MAAVLQVQIIPVSRAASVLQSLYPHARIRVDLHANALIVIAPPDQVESMRTVLQGIDVRNPTQPSVQVLQLKSIKPAALISRIQALFPNASLSAASKSSVLLRATPLDMTQITALIGSLDTTGATPAPAYLPVQAFAVRQAAPRTIARAVAHELPGLRVSVSGSNILVTGDPDQVSKAKDLIASLDAPAYGSRYTQIYRIKNVDATSVADLVSRTFPNVRVTVDKDLNTLSVLATAGEQQRISDAIGQLDGAAGSGSSVAGGSSGAAYGSSNVEVVQLQAPMPGQNQAPSTTAQDIATAVAQSLGQLAPDLHVTVPANSTSIILSGSPTSIRLAKDLIAKLDVVPPLVVLDTEVLEVDESAARNLGLQLPTAVLGTTFQEISPPYDPVTGLPGRIGRGQPITRTPLQLTAQLNILISNGNARVLANPRVTTISGHTATIRAGDTLAILTTTGGGVGSPVTQQLQTFNTGVTLDITPMVSSRDDVIVALHPVVNSLSGILNGVPQISTRDTQTVVHLKDDQTLVIGGLIQEQLSRQVSSIPLLGEIPLIGRLFRNDNTTSTRNELIIVVTPHVLKEGENAPPPGSTIPLPTPAPLPTLPPGTTMPHMYAYETPAPHAPPTLSTPIPSPKPSPLPEPTAFAQANVYVFGQAPQNTFASPTDAAQIFYARFSPTLLRSGIPVTVQAITTTNVTRVTIGTPGFTTSLASVAPSKWQATYTFNALGLPPGQNNAQLSLTAYRDDGTNVSIQIPVSLLNQ
jgi:type II secretory pathway component GspD/PulD (secretin)